MLKLRQWDKCAADRVDYFIANSHYIAKRIKKYYRRDSDVIYPCVHINEEPFVPKEDFTLWWAALPGTSGLTWLWQPAPS